MADDETLSTDSDDDEYVPEGNDSCSSSDDVELSGGDDEWRKTERNEKRRSRRKRRSSVELRKLPPRKKKSMHEMRLPDTSESPDEENEEGTSSDDKNDNSADQERKARLDELWAGFKKDVGTPTTSKPRAIITDTQPSESDSKTVKIKKTYDFAGEDVIVEETVQADSQEAINYNKKLSEKNVSQQISQSPCTKNVLGAKALLQSLNKKQKLSTLDKSRLDWDKYKSTEGIEEELQFHNKDGFLEKREFLARTDLKQFEQERDERLKRFKTLY